MSAWLLYLLLALGAVLGLDAWFVMWLFWNRGQHLAELRRLPDGDEPGVRLEDAA